MIRTSRPKITAALEYAERSWRVFPVFEIDDDGTCSCGKACESPGKHPRTQNGVDDATTSAHQLMVWWTRWPRANPTNATGRESGLIVLDVDPRNGGEESLADLERDRGRLADTVIVHTGGGGLHYYFAHPQGELVIPNRRNLGGYRGLDLKGEGGYVVAPPSNHLSGVIYAFDLVFHPDAVALAPLPAALLELSSMGPSGARVEYEVQPFEGDDLPLRVRLVLRDPRVRARFERDASGLSDSSPSGVDYALASLLANRGLDGWEIERAVLVSRAQAALPEKRRSYFEATIGKALAEASVRVA